MKGLLVKIAAFFLFFAVTMLDFQALFAAPGTGYIHLYSPQKRAVSKKPLILFKGTVKNTDRLTLNGVALSIDKDGRFFHKQALKYPERYQVFVLKSFSKGTLNQELVRRVYYTPSGTRPQQKRPRVEVSSERSLSPVFELLTPKEDLIATADVLLFSGRVPSSGVLSINGKSIQVGESGFFSYKQKLTQPNAYTHFLLKLEMKDGKIYTKKRRVFFKQQEAAALEQAVQLTVFTPLHQSIVTGNTVRFSGKVLGAKTLSLDGKKQYVRQDGTFQFEQRVKRRQEGQVFVLKAVASNGRHVEVKRRVRYKKKVLSLLKQDKDIVTAHNKKIAKKTASSLKKSSKLFPKIIIKHPQNNFVTYQNKVVLKGRVDNVREFFINSRIVKVDEGGHFHEEFDLKKLGKYVFNLYALGENNLNRTMIRKVFRISEKEIENELQEKEVSSHKFQKKLKKKISLDLHDTDIKDVLQILSKKGSLNIISDKNLVGKINVTLDDLPIDSAIDLILSSQGLSYVIQEDTLIVGSAENLNKASRLVSKIIRLDNAQAEAAKDAMLHYLSSEESIKVIENNALLVVADPKKISKIVRVLNQIDAQKVPQVILEAQILEVSQSSLDDVGIAWNNTYGVGVNATLKDGDFSYTSGISLKTVINLLEQEGKARILAKPRIKAIDRELAEIFIGDELPFIELATDATGRVQESVRYINSGILLKVQPFINTNTNEIKIKINPEVSYVNGFKGKNNDIPIVRKRTVKTTVFVKDSETVLIGGLFNSSDSTNVSRFPVLGRLPWVKTFFKSNKKMKDETELVIAITPTIVTLDLSEEKPELMESQN